ncbi:hypothetical protein QJQ45_017584 [Haematococcus lacustris]|nr:hypothetical protein QJQ45_017584 [Haematococcus lacustris]
MNSSDLRFCCGRRTFDPEEADFFYVPQYSTCFIFPIKNWADFPWFGPPDTGSLLQPRRPCGPHAAGGAAQSRQPASPCSTAASQAQAPRQRPQGAAPWWLVHRSSVTLGIYDLALCALPAAQVHRYLSTQFPYWNRRQGRDHIFLFTHDEGACWVPRVLTSAVWLTHWGRTELNHTSNTAYMGDNYNEDSKCSRMPDGWRHHITGHACYDPVKGGVGQWLQDLVVPSHKTIDQYSHSPLMGAAPKERDIFFFFRGDVGKHRLPNYSRGIRQAVYKMVQDNNLKEKYNILVGDGGDVPGSYSELLSRSLFCLVGACAAAPSPSSLPPTLSVAVLEAPTASWTWTAVVPAWSPTQWRLTAQWHWPPAGNGSSASSDSKNQEEERQQQQQQQQQQESGHHACSAVATAPSQPSSRGQRLPRVWLAGRMQVAPGDGYSARMEDAALNGCIPVIIQDGVHVEFETLLNFTQFTVRVLEKDIPNLVNVLKSIPPASVRSMQRHLSRVFHRFRWAFSPQQRLAAQALTDSNLGLLEATRRGKAEEAGPTSGRQLQRGLQQPQQGGAVRLPRPFRGDVAVDDAFATIMQWWELQDQLRVEPLLHWAAQGCTAARLLTLAWDAWGVCCPVLCCAAKITKLLPCAGCIAGYPSPADYHQATTCALLHASLTFLHHNVMATYTKPLAAQRGGVGHSKLDHHLLPRLHR